jgi:hypothetical protein
MADPVARLQRAAAGYDVKGLVVHRGRGRDTAPVSLGRGVRAVAIETFTLDRL